MNSVQNQHALYAPALSVNLSSAAVSRTIRSGIVGYPSIMVKGSLPMIREYSNGLAMIDGEFYWVADLLQAEADFLGYEI